MLVTIGVNLKMYALLQCTGNYLIQVRDTCGQLYDCTSHEKHYSLILRNQLVIELNRMEISHQKVQRR